MRDAFVTLLFVATAAACTPDWASPKDAGSEQQATDAATEADDASPVDSGDSEERSQAPGVNDASDEPPSDSGSDHVAPGDAAQKADCGSEYVPADGNACGCPLGFEDNGDGCEDVDDCAKNPCMNGGTCVDAVGARVCHCGNGFLGADCELEICGDLYIRSAADLLNNRLCGKVQGNLLIESGAGLASITADDLPHLTEVTGSLSVFARLDAMETNLLRSVTLAKLQVVGGPISFSAVNGRGPAEELHFPALSSIGGAPVGAGSSRDGLGLLQAGVKNLDMPNLTTIEGHVLMEGLPRLCTVNLRQVKRVAGNVRLSGMPNAPAGTFDALRAAAVGTITELTVGCCLPFDRTACDGFSTSAECGC